MWFRIFDYDFYAFRVWEALNDYEMPEPENFRARQWQSVVFAVSHCDAIMCELVDSADYEKNERYSPGKWTIWRATLRHPSGQRRHLKLRVTWKEKASRVQLHELLHNATLSGVFYKKLEENLKKLERRLSCILCSKVGELFGKIRSKRFSLF